MRWTADDVAAAAREEELRRLPLAAMFTALGVLLPQIFHALGLGSAFLPIFLPVLAAGLLLSFRLTMIVAVLTPLLSWILTGMPPLAPPVLPLLLVELPAAGGMVSLLRRHLRWPVLAAVAVAMAVDRLLLFAMIEIVSTIAGVQHPLLGPAVVLVGLPGILLQLIVLPPAILLIERRFPRFTPAEAREIRS